MGFFDVIKNTLFGTERVNSAKSECRTKKKTSEDKYKEETARIEAECAANLAKAKEMDKQSATPTSVSPIAPPPAPVVSEQEERESPRMMDYGNEQRSNREEERDYRGGKKGGKRGKSRKGGKSKSNRRKSMRKGK